MEEDDLDDVLYNDLDYKFDAPNAIELEEELNAVKQQLAKAKQELEESKKREEEKSDLLLKNISCLYNTAKTELEAKSKEVERQKQEIESLKARSGPASDAKTRDSHSRGTARDIPRDYQRDHARPSPRDGARDHHAQHGRVPEQNPMHHRENRERPDRDNHSQNRSVAGYNRETYGNSYNTTRH